MPNTQREIFFKPSNYFYYFYKTHDLKFWEDTVCRLNNNNFYKHFLNVNKYAQLCGICMYGSVCICKKQ